MRDHRRMQSWLHVLKWGELAHHDASSSEAYANYTHCLPLRRTMELQHFLLRDNLVRPDLVFIR
jgi:hypothetical protein